MSTDVTQFARSPRLERLLTWQLRYGTWLASAVTAAGILLELVHRQAAPNPPSAASGIRVIASGVALFILLPIVRLVMMLTVFLHERDYLFGAIATAVLGIMAAGTAVAVYLP